MAKTKAEKITSIEEEIRQLDRSRANPAYGGKRLIQRRDERQDHNPDNGMESRVCQTGRREENLDFY